MAGNLIERAEYLRRINFSGAPRPDADNLLKMQLAHLKAVPFENLDIALGRGIKLDLPSLWEKIVVRRRGGFCYELNGIFAWLLRDIGFDVTYLNARVYSSKDGSLGIDFDHLALLVGAPGSSTRWLTDVGFGDTFIAPLRFEAGAWQAQGRRAYRIEALSNGYRVWQRDHLGNDAPQYFFDLSAHQYPAEYLPACRYHSTSPESSFTRKRIITRLTDHGRVSLDDESLIESIDYERSETRVLEADRPALLKKYFDVMLA